MTQPLGISQAGLDFIKRWEALRLEAYRDGGGVWTIGYGHTGTARSGMKITPAQADQLLLRDLAGAESEIRQAVKVPLNQAQFDALASFEFNTGGLRLMTSKGQLRDSVLLRKLNAGDVKGAAAEFMEWTHDNGRVVAGLVNRRLAEKTIFLGGASG